MSTGDTPFAPQTFFLSFGAGQSFPPPPRHSAYTSTWLSPNKRFSYMHMQHPWSFDWHDSFNVAYVCMYVPTESYIGCK